MEHEEQRLTTWEAGNEGRPWADLKIAGQSESPSSFH